MASWSELEAAAPELARRVRRRDGSPSISGTEAELRDGERAVSADGEAHFFRLDIREASTPEQTGLSCPGLE